VVGSSGRSKVLPERGGRRLTRHEGVSGFFAASARHRTRRFGDFDVHVALGDHDGAGHLVLVRGDVADCDDVLCRVASACVTSTALDAADCDCRDQLDASLELIARADHGVVIYLDQEGRGHGIATKIRALANKNAGLDTLAAVEALGLPTDVRSYRDVAQILTALTVRSVVLLTNNPIKAAQIDEAGVQVSSIRPLRYLVPPEASRHVAAKKARGLYIDEAASDGDYSQS
jgi:3,4-dihydroxy 2-butanone 4-phosphate synthase/GTP cyclohydrolase II